MSVLDTNDEEYHPPVAGQLSQEEFYNKTGSPYIGTIVLWQASYHKRSSTRWALLLTEEISAWKQSDKTPIKINKLVTPPEGMEFTHSACHS